MAGKTNRGCVVHGCTAKHHARGLCRRHYDQVRRNGWLKVMTKGYGDEPGHGEMAHTRPELFLEEAA